LLATTKFVLISVINCTYQQVHIYIIEYILYKGYITKYKYY